MAGEGAQDGTQSGFLLRCEHEAFQIAKPDDRRGMMGENGTCRLHELVQRESRKVNPLGLLRNGHGIYGEH